MNKDGFATTLVPIDQIRNPLFQCRTASLDADLGELADSIKAVGLLEPLTVRIDKDKKPELVIGSRRLKACKIAGLSMVPVIIRELSDEEALEIEGSENLNRNDLTPEDKTRLVSEWAKRGYDAEGIARKVHKKLTWVYSFLPFEFKDKIKSEAGKLGGEAYREAYRKSQDFAPKIGAESEDTRQETNPAEELMQKAKEVTESVECHNCKMGFARNTMKPIEGQFYCSTCYPKCAPFIHVAKKNGRSLQGWKEKPEFRVAKMKPGVSKMDEAMLVKLENSAELRELGWKVEFQKAYYKVVCVSDVSLVRPDRHEELLLFWDGSKVHNHPEKDEAAREIAKEELLRQDVLADVFVRPYKVHSTAEVERLYDELLAFLRESEKWNEKPHSQAEEVA